MFWGYHTLNNSASGFVLSHGNPSLTIHIQMLATLSCMSTSSSHRCYDTLNLGKPSKPKYATEQQDETVSIIRSRFRADMSNFSTVSSSIKYLGKVLDFQIFPVPAKRDCTSAHLLGFSQQTGLCFRPQMKLQKQPRIIYVISEKQLRFLPHLTMCRSYLCNMHS